MAYIFSGHIGFSMDYQKIVTSVRTVLSELPAHVDLIAAAKTRTADEVNAAIEAGVRIIGYNYVQEAERIRPEIMKGVKWHLIGHLQRNKVRKALDIFDVIETVDSLKLAEVIDRVSSEAETVTPVLIEVNSGREREKSGVFPENTEILVRGISKLNHIRVVGLMTMGPVTDDGEETRPCFRETRKIFDTLSAMQIPGVDMRYLSMGMSASYRIAIEEGANQIRLGTKLFGSR
jgi:pyridoxal phosphate enzyme (YggS family)